MTREQAMVHARVVIRGMVKDELKRQNVKISCVETSEITKAVNHFIRVNPKFVDAYIKHKMKEV